MSCYVLQQFQDASLLDAVLSRIQDRVSILVLFTSLLDVSHIHGFPTLSKNCNFLYSRTIFVALVVSDKYAETCKRLEFDKPAGDLKHSDDREAICAVCAAPRHGCC